MTVGGTTQMAEVRSGGSYLSQSDLRLHFGLGAAAVMDKVEILWPDGKRQSFEKVTAGRFYELEEGGALK